MLFGEGNYGVITPASGAQCAIKVEKKLMRHKDIKKIAEDRFTPVDLADSADKKQDTLLFGEGNYGVITPASGAQCAIKVEKKLMRHRDIKNS